MVSKEELARIKQGYAELQHNPTFKHLLGKLNDMAQDAQNKAGKTSDPYESYGLSKEARGIIRVLEYIKTQTTDTSR